MPFDKFSPCPCGSGKKAKFCCAKDLVHEFETLQRMIEGDQRIAAVEHIERLLKTHPDLPCLLAMKGELHLQLNAWPELEETAGRLLAKEPHSNCGLSQMAVVHAVKGELRAAIDRLQDALEHFPDNSMSYHNMNALQVLGSALQGAGAMVAARGHLLFLALTGMAQDRRLAAPFVRLQSSPALPLLAKDEISAPAPADAPWASAFQEAVTRARRGRMRAGAEALRKLAEQYPKEPAILAELAMQLGHLDRRWEAADVWRQFALLPGVDHETAVEAEGLAQIVLGQPIADPVSTTLVTFTLDDTEGVMERLLSDQRVVRAGGDLKELVEEGEPPPRAAFLLLDRPPQAGQPLELENLPVILGQVLVFGRETDRPARLEFIAIHDVGTDKDTALLGEIIGSMEPSAREDVGENSDWLSTNLFPRWFLPERITSGEQMGLMREHAIRVLLRQWPKHRTMVLDGKSPEEAAADFNLRLRVEALILRLECEELPNLADFDFNQLRRKLDLPTRETIAPTTVNMETLPVVRLGRIEASKLSDDQLLAAFQRAQTTSAVRALRVLGPELLSRDSLKNQVDKNALYAMLVQTSTSPQAALDLVLQAQQEAKSQGQSPAQWLLLELNLRLQRGEVEEVQQLMNTLQSRHMKEPGVAEALFQFLYSIGAVTADGRPNPEFAGAQAGAAAAPAAAPAPGVWTPGASEPAPTEPGKSKLWIPGMD